MATRAVKERLAQDIGQWLTDGFIRAGTAESLRQRWDQPGFGLAQVVRYVGYSGGLLALFGLFGLAAAMSGSESFSGLLLAAVGGALLSWGVRLSLDVQGRYELSSKSVLGLGFVAFALGIGVVAHGAGAGDAQAIVVAGCVALPVALGLAYRFNNAFLLVLGLLGLYHWIGSMSRMLGRSTYSIDVQDPRLMSLAAGGGALFGVLHERLWPKAVPSFSQAWIAVGLTYLNLSLLILSIDSRDTALTWILIWAVAGMAQVALGARLHSALFTAFGVTALGVNLFTRYFERFWDKLDAGLFFLGGGAALFLAGFLFELRARRTAEPGRAST